MTANEQPYGNGAGHGRPVERIGRLLFAALGLAWLLPNLVLPLGLVGMPVSPLIVAAIFFIF